MKLAFYFYCLVFVPISVFSVSSFDQQLMEQAFEVNDRFLLLTIPDCNVRVAQCLQHLDDHAKVCKRLWKESLGPRYDQCSTINHVKAAYDNWSQTSAIWRQTFIDCLTSPLNQRTRPVTSPKKSSRQYRETEITTSKYAFLTSDHAHHSDNVVECWTTLGDHKAKCEEQYAVCEQYKNCVGVGNMDANSSSRRVSELAKLSQKKGRTYFERLGTCLESNANGVSQKLKAVPKTTMDHHHHHHHHE